MYIAATIRHLVRVRAKDRCEFCLLPQSQSMQEFHVDHFVARKHGGKTSLSNLALCCSWCNLHKGTDLAGLDPCSGKIVALFNPRRQRWAAHFRFSGAMIMGKTAQGKATVATLQLNEVDQMARRRVLMAQGLYTPRAEQ
jgi:hypothetical protein